ncbi:MAG: hypothetical protein ACR2FY_15050 [Pirellulaceae bacterium]
MRLVSATPVDGFDTPYSIGKPNTTFQRHYLVNIEADVADNDYGVASWLSEADFFLAGGSPAVGDSYGATPSSWAATKNRYGFTVTGGTVGSGATQRVTGRQQFADELIGKTTGIAKGSTGTFTIWQRNSSTGTWETSGLTITARALGAALTTGKYAQASWRCGEWVAGPWEC